uniref:Sj ts4 protein n=1 Tax=Echinococcus granulosus TaxID=6210 RepID=A0A068X1A9_ECHGR|nr:sj ts4 protein [Echinococcus granulosus]
MERRIGLALACLAVIVFTDHMATFSDRLSHYPLISDSLKAASDAYNWVSSGERFRSIFQLSESAASAIRDQAKALASTDAVTKLDDIACRQILDRLEAVIPSVKKPTGELLGQTADRALDAAESYLEYFLPDTKTDFEGKAVASRYDRLMRLQSALVNSEKVQAAQNTISNAYKGIQDQLASLSAVTSKDKREAMLSIISSLATEYKQAAEVAFPRFKAFVAGAISQLHNFTQELRQTDNVTQMAIDQLQATVNGLHSTLLSLNERRERWLHGPSAETKPSTEKVSDSLIMLVKLTLLIPPSTSSTFTHLIGHLLVYLVNIQAKRMEIIFPFTPSYVGPWCFSVPIS